MKTLVTVLLLTMLLGCDKEPLQNCDCGVLIDTFEFADTAMSKNWQGWIWQSDCGVVDSTFYWKESDGWYVGKRICKLKYLESVK